MGVSPPLWPPEWPRWWMPKRATCSVWAVGQWLMFGGRSKMIRNPKVREMPWYYQILFFWLFRVLWSPEPDAHWPDKGVWFGYIPLHPLKPGVDPWWRVLKHSLWFEGRVRRERVKGVEL